jgi:regulator of sigma E protease
MVLELALIKKLFFILAGIGGISGLIFFHELGHFLFCKLFKIHTPTFSIGIGPELFSRMIGKTRFIIAAIPLGGYVEIAGMVDTQQSDATQSTEKAYSFETKPYYQKLLVMLGGILFNLIFAYAAFSLVHFVGAPAAPILYIETATPTIARFAKDSSAEKLGLLQGDTILAINENPLGSSITPFLKYTPAQDAATALTLMRANESITIMVPADAELCTKPFSHLGIVFAQEKKAGVPFIQAIQKGIATTHRWIANTARGFLHIFKNRDFSSAGGPIRIIAMIAENAADGILMYLLFLAIISVNLALFNLFPAPILDGGQILICTIEALVRRQLPVKTKEYLFIGTWIVFLVLIAYLSFKDICHIAMPKISALMSYLRGQ